MNVRGWLRMHMWRSEDSWMKLVLSCHVSPRIKLVNFGGECFCPMTHLTSPVGFSENQRTALPNFAAGRETLEELGCPRCILLLWPAYFCCTEGQVFAVATHV